MVLLYLYKAFWSLRDSFSPSALGEAEGKKMIKPHGFLREGDVDLCPCSLKLVICMNEYVLPGCCRVAVK